jgi:hypothetical protein
MWIVFLRLWVHWQAHLNTATKFGFRKRRGISLAAELLLASQEGL